MKNAENLLKKEYAAVVINGLLIVHVKKNRNKKELFDDLAKWFQGIRKRKKQLEERIMGKRNEKG